jgi:hypothetical protein
MKNHIQSEKEIQNLIYKHFKKKGYPIFRINVGSVKMQDGRYFNSGVRGHPDLYGFIPPTGRIFFIEVKKPKGRISFDQKVFLKNAVDNGALAGVARSVEDAIAIVEGRKQFDGTVEKVVKSTPYRKNVDHLIGGKSVFEMSEEEFHNALFNPALFGKGKKR